MGVGGEITNILSTWDSVERSEFYNTTNNTVSSSRSDNKSQSSCSTDLFNLYKLDELTK